MNNLGLLLGHRAVVTGAAAGLGAALAIGFAESGADVAICDRDAEGLGRTAAQIRSLGREAFEAQLDVRDGDAIAQFSTDVATQFGTIDVLVNNAGGGFYAPFADITPKGEAALIAENFTQVTSCIRAFVDRFDERGGAIINVTSIEAHRAGPGFSIYSAMKAAVESLTKTLALELSPKLIRVNALAPDMLITPGDAGLTHDSGAMLVDSWLPTPLGAAASPDAIVGPALFLASDMSRFVTGTTLHVDGGNSAAFGWKRTLDDGWAV